MASTASAGNTPSQRVRQLWRAFEQWQAPKRAEMQRQCNLSSNSRAQRQEIEERHYSTARQEWQRRLASAGLKDQDWGNMSATETKAVELALGGGDGAGPSASNGDQETATSSMSLVPHAYASTPASHPSALLQPPQIGSSFSTSSAASGFSSGYEVVNPSEFVSDDEDEDGNDEGGDGFLFQVAVVTAQHEIRSASASEDEGHKSYLGQTTSASSGHYGTGYNVTSPTSTTNQWRPYETPSYHHWSSSESSSQHPSANASPAQPPSMAIYSSSAMTGMSSITTSASTTSSATAKAIPSTSTSSGWGATASALSSATTSAYAAVSSMSLFGTSPPEAGTTQTSKPKASSSSKPSSSASASASASALVPVSAFSSSTHRGPSQTKGVSASNSISASSSTSSTNPSSMAIVTRQATPPYIGPILSDSGDDDHDEHAGSQYDPEEAELDFKKFKTRTRMDKIIEFHREAAELEVRLVVEIERMRVASDLPPQAEKRLIDGHHAQMRALQQSKEMERQRIVKDERRRRRRALTVASASSSTSSLSLALVPQWNPNQGHPRSVRTGKLRNTEWLNAYEKVSTDFEVSMPGGFEFDEEPATVSYDHQHHQPSPSSSSPYQYGYPHQQQNQFGSPYADLPTPQGAHSGGSFQQQQQQQPQNGQYWSPPGAQTFSPPSSSPASSSNNDSPSSFRDFAPLAGSNGGSNPHGRGSALQGHTLLQPPRPPTQSPRIARPRPMPAWNPQQLEMSAEEDEGEDGHENQQEYDWGSEPGYERGYASGQGQGRGYEGHSSYDSGAEDHSQWNGAYGNHHAQQQQQQVYEHTPPSMYETIQMSSDSFHDDDAYAGHMQNGFGGAGGGDYFGTEEIPDELRAAMGGFTSFGQGQYSPPSNRAQTVTNAREEQRREQQLPQRKGLPINSKRRNSDLGREEKKSMPGGMKNGNGDALNSSTNTVNGGVMNKTPTTTSPLASFIPSKLNNLGFGSLWGGRGGASQDDSRQVKEVEEEEEESDEEEEEEDDEEETWSTSPPQKKQAPAPPPKKAAPPPPAPAPTTAKGRKAAAALAKAQAAAQAKAQAEDDAKVAAAAKAAEEAENEKKAAEAARESKAAPPVPEKATAGGKKQTKKQKQAAAKKGGNAKGEVPSSPVEEKKKAPASPVNAKDNKPPVELETTRKMSSSSFLSSSVLSTGSEGGWEEASSTPRPSAATIKVQPGWGSKNQQQQDVLGSTKQGGMLRKQTVVQQAQQQQEMSGTNGKANASGGLVIDNSPLPDDVAQARWGRLSQKPAATPVSAATPTAPSPAASAGWKMGGKVRRNSDGGKDALESPAAQNGFARVSNGSGSTRKARNGFSSAPKKVTIEEVSDEEADIVVDGNLGVESRYLLESTEEIEREQHELQHPRPSMPPSSYSNIIGAGEHYDDGFPSSANSSFGPPTPSTAPTSPPDDVPPEDFFSSATKSLKMQHTTRGQGGGHSSSASGFASDFDATIRQRPRWSTMGNKRPASSATVGAGAGGSMQSLFRHKAIPMAAPTSSSESDELTSPMGAIPGGFPSTARGNVNAGNAAGRGGDLQRMKEQMRAAALANGARPTTSMPNVPSAVGGPRQIEETSPADNARVERFLQAQRQEVLKRGGR